MKYLFPFTSLTNTLAFPSDESDGMTLLDYFAGQCLTAIVHNGRRDLDDEEIAEMAYGLAMSMIEARKGLAK